VDCKSCGSLVADLVVYRISEAVHEKEQNSSNRDLDRSKRKKVASLFPEEDWEDVLFVEYVSKTGCSPNPRSAPAFRPPAPSRLKKVLY